MEEDLTHNWKHSHPITYTSETPVKKEKAESPLNVINHQSVTLPQESSSPANIFSANQLIDMPESLPQGAFREELMGAQINSHICKLLPRNDGGTQTDELHPGKINGKTAMDLMDTEIACQVEDASAGHVNSQARSPLYGLSAQVHTATWQMKRTENSASQEVFKPVYTYNGGDRSQRLQKHRLELFRAPTNDIVPYYYSCPTGCQCGCHAPIRSTPSYLTAIDKEHQRPGVIMVPVSSASTAALRTTHVPLQMKGRLYKPLQLSMEHITDNRTSEDDSDSDSEENYFQKNIDGAKARFKLTKTDWEKIPIKSFPSGGRLLGGEWTRIFNSKVKESNPWCSLRFKNNHVRSANSRKKHSAPFFRGGAECKYPECHVKLQFTILEEKGKYVGVTYKGNVCHKLRS